MELKGYRKSERTIAQFKAMELKKSGAFVFRLTDRDTTVAFGYKKSNTNTIKEVVTRSIHNAKEEDYDFIYWN